MAELIEMLFGVVTQAGPINHALDGVQMLPADRAILGGVAAHCKQRASQQRISMTHQVASANRSTCLKIARARNSSAKCRHCADTFL